MKENIKLAINGFGRIGRNVLKIALERNNIQIVGVNDLTDNETLAHLFKYDSTQGTFPGTVSHDEENIIINNEKIKCTAEKDPSRIPWSDTPDVVIEATGVFRTRDGERGGYGDHLKNGAKKVLLTVPAKDDIDRMIVIGVNDEHLLSSDETVSNASCTTNCLAPLVKVLNDSFGVKQGLMTTIHSYTNTQRLLDAPHKDLRRSRAAALSIIPTTTGAAKAVGKVIPELDGKINGMAVRTPTPTGSLVDFVAMLDKKVSVEEVNAAMKEASETNLKGILQYCDEPIVSIDIVHNPHSSIFDSLCTMTDGNMVKILSWYDNEWGYSSRVVDLALKLI